MKSINKTIISTICMVFIVSTQMGNAQETLKKHMLTAMPQYLIYQGLRIDLDRRIGESNRWLTFSTRFYLHEVYKEDEIEVQTELPIDYEYDSKYGIGAGLNYKIFFDNSGVPDKLYHAYGVFFNYYTFRYRAEDWGYTDFNGVSALEYGLYKKRTIIYQPSAEMILGYLYNYHSKVVFDFYAGVGFNYSFIDSNSKPVKLYDSDIISLGYTGFLPKGGVRIGVIL